MENPETPGRKTVRVSFVIPALNAANTLPGVVDAIACADGTIACDITVVDGGSTDGTRKVAREKGARVLPSARGRGRQLRAGGEAAPGAWLLFLHADTRLAPGWRRAVREFATEPANGNRAAVFRLRLDDAHPQARRVERLVGWRTRALGLPYGDQGLLISRGFHDRIGGFKPLPLFEDVDIVRRIGKRRLDMLDADAITSADRYRRGGWWLRPARNLACLALYFLGVPPRLIEKLYR